MDDLTTLQSPPTSFVARQAMLDLRGTPYGYRVVSAPPDVAPPGTIAPHHAAHVVSTVIEVGITALVGNRTAIVPVDVRLLQLGILEELNPTQVLLELPAAELMEDPSSIAALVRSVRGRGHRLAISGATPSTMPRHLLALVDLIEFDAMRGALAANVELASTAARMGIVPCASGIELQEQYEQVKDHFSLFVGSYYQRPVISPDASMSTGRLTTVQLLAECANPDATLKDFEAIVSRDPALAFRVLELANSAAAGLVRRIDSLWQAMVMVGVNNIRNLAMIASLNGLHDRSPELLRTVLLRAKLCELLARQVRVDHTSAFTAGLLSLLDAFIALPIDEALERVALSEELQAAILDHRGRLGQILRMAIACDRAIFPPDLDTIVPLRDAATVYLEAVGWVDGLGMPTAV
jgi:EAL and modified HD-GYP domain-containing signal transduction protein